jgi:hypothetical protein
VLELLGEGRWAVRQTEGYALAPELEEADDLGSAVVRAKPEVARSPRAT